MTEIRKRAKPDTPWWDHRWIVHPMTDEAFRDAYFEYLLCRSDDRSLASVRRRARFFVDMVCRDQMADSLAAYRREHPID
jgi:hypothetical protein